MILRLVLILALTGACGSPKPATSEAGGGSSPTSSEPSAQHEQAVAGVTDPELRALLAEHWDWTLRTNPEWATTLGDHRFDRELSDPSHEAVMAENAAEAKLLERARAIDAGRLDAADRLTLQLFIEELAHGQAMAACKAHLWTVAAMGNPVSNFSYLPERHAIRNAADADNLVARYRQIAGAVDAEIANLRRGASEGLYPSAESARRTLALVEGHLEKPDADWALMKPAVTEHEALSAAERGQLAAELREIVAQQIRPAFTRYRDLLRDEIVPKARGAESVGLGALPVGKDCYAASVLAYTGLERSPAELHQLGLAEIERINREMTALGNKLFGTSELAAVLDKLRNDKALYFDSKEAIVSRATESLAAAREAIPRYFGVLPKAECVVREIPQHDAPFTTIAYYRQPHADGSKPGEYFVNTYQPETRPTFEAQVLAYHESIPGHHLQIAIAQEQSALPAFRRFGGQTAFVEGWALYTERLADEMGLYSGDLDRMGMLSYDAWRAARLVVDTGIHAMGWTREQAERFMREHTALATNNIANEVDRYIGWPGQALAYKVGQLEIARLRADAEQRLGERFDIREFHDVVLGSGAVSLPVLEQLVSDWVARRESAR